MAFLEKRFGKAFVHKRPKVDPVPSSPSVESSPLPERVPESPEVVQASPQRLSDDDLEATVEAAQESGVIVRDDDAQVVLVIGDGQEIIVIGGDDSITIEQRPPRPVCHHRPSVPRRMKRKTKRTFDQIAAAAISAATAGCIPI